MNENKEFNKDEQEGVFSKEQTEQFNKNKEVQQSQPQEDNDIENAVKEKKNVEYLAETIINFDKKIVDINNAIDEIKNIIKASKNSLTSSETKTSETDDDNWTLEI